MSDDSRYSGRPVLLMRCGFEAGGEIYSLGATNAERPLEYGGVAYEPIPVDTDTLAEGTVDREALTVRVPKASEIGFLLWPVVPMFVVTLEIDIADLDSTGAIVAGSARRRFAGTVSGTSSQGEGELRISVVPLISGLARAGLDRTYSHACPHALFGPRCGLSRAGHTHATVAAAVSKRGLDADSWYAGNKLTFDLPVTLDIEAVVGGTVSWDGPKGLIIMPVYDADIAPLLTGVTRYVVTIPVLPPGLEQGTPVTFTQGCPHNLSGCSDIYNNAVNYGGFPWIPQDNPVGRLLIGR